MKEKKDSLIPALRIPSSLAKQIDWAVKRLRIDNVASVRRQLWKSLVVIAKAGGRLPWLPRVISEAEDRMLVHHRDEHHRHDYKHKHPQ